jgi:ABC-type glycerol-3-phosphate transport system substrate-binding protein
MGHARPAGAVDKERAMANLEGSRAVNRRAFLKVAGTATGAAVAGGIPGIVLAQKAPSFPKGTKLHILEWVSFVPASDVEFKRLAGEFGKVAGVDVTVELINMNDLNPRIAAAIENKAGPDIIMMLQNWPHLYADGLADVDDVAEEIGKRDGGFYDTVRNVSVVGKTWKSVPLAVGTPAWAYREDWFKEVGATKFPDTWDELRTVGTKLKKKNQPIGQAFGHSLGDPNQWAYPVTWSFGGAEIDQKGKVVINSKETIEALKFTVGFWKDCLDEGGLAWDDTSNNRAYLAGTISATINGASIYFVAKRQFPDIAKVTNHGHMPRGPAGRFYSIQGQGHAVMKYSKNQQVAREFLRWFMDRPQYDPWFAANDGYVNGPTHYWEKHALWERDLKLVPFKEASKFGRMPGYAGPPNRKSSEALVKYILVDMYAQAIKGMKPEDAAKWAEVELKKAYGA